MMRTGLVNMGIGVLLAAAGIVATVISYSAVSHSGGTYYVAWGAVAVGAWRFLLGAFQFLGGLAGERSPANTGITSPYAAGGIAPTTPVGAASGELAAPVLVIGVLLIVQALLRGGFLANLLLHVPGTLFDNPTFLILSVAVPALLAIGGLVAGGLVLSQSEAARGFGLAFCAIGMLHQIYGAANLLLTAMHQPAFHLPWVALILIPFNIVVYVAGLIILATSSPDTVRA